MLQSGELSALVLGGTRSGKSAHAEQMALSSGDAPHYIATSQVFDGEMAHRITLHKNRRGPQWSLAEEPLRLCEAIGTAPENCSAILVDCLTLWLSNLMHHECDVPAESTKLLDLIPSLTKPVIFVSSEVGMGIVPENALARDFRDHQGHLNQRLAATVDRVDFIAAGLPLTLKTKGIGNEHGH